MKKNRKVWLIRHALREDNNPDDWSKTINHMEDPDLHPIGLAMAERTAGHLAGRGIEHLFVSPFLRTLRTGHYLSRKLGLTMKVEFAVHEQFSTQWFPHGPATFPSLEERARTFPTIDLAYRSESRRPLAHENPEDPHNPLLDRVDRAIAHILSVADGDVAIVAHYATCNCLMRSLTGVFSPGYIELTSITEIVSSGQGWERVNGPDSSHISDILKAGKNWKC